jgi:hypothetical protein
MAFEITKKEFFLAISLTLLGFIFSTRSSLQWFDKLDPFTGLIVYYLIIFIAVFLLSKAGLVISYIRFGTLAQTIGVLLIIFSFNIVTDYESCYQNEILKGSCENISNIYFQSEDGSIYYFMSKFTDDIQVKRIFTYLITPFILTLLGALLIEQKVRL